MNPLDTIIIVIIAFCLIRGAFRGLVKEISSIIGVLGGFYAAYTYYTEISAPLSKLISNIAYLNILSFLFIFCIVYIIISFSGILIKNALNIAFLGWVDRICGAGFGITKGVMITAVLLIALTAFLPKKAPVIKNSVLAPLVTMVSEKMVKVISDDMKIKYKIKIKELKKSWGKS